MSHSLNSFNFLKFEDKNFIGYERGHPHRTICVQQEYIKQNLIGQLETTFDTLLRVKLFETTIQELLVFQGLYFAKSQACIVNLV